MNDVQKHNVSIACSCTINETNVVLRQHEDIFSIDINIRLYKQHN